MDQGAGAVWGGIAGGLAGAIVVVASDWTRLTLAARRDRRKLKLWTYLYPRLLSATFTEDQILQDCRCWLHGRAELYALLYEILRDGTILPDLLFRIRGDSGGS